MRQVIHGASVVVDLLHAMNTFLSLVLIFLALYAAWYVSVVASKKREEQKQQWETLKAESREKLEHAARAAEKLKADSKEAFEKGAKAAKTASSALVQNSSEMMPSVVEKMKEGREVSKALLGQVSDSVVALPWKHLSKNSSQS